MPQVTPKEIVSGDALMVFMAGKSIAYATSHTLTLTAETASVNSKDHGIWTGNEVNKRSWEISSENLYSDDEFEGIFDKWVKATPVTLVWCKKKEADTVVVADCDAEYYTPDNDTAGKKYFTGKAYITNITANANTGEKATFSATFTGTGKFEMVTVEGNAGE